MIHPDHNHAILVGGALRELKQWKQSTTVETGIKMNSCLAETAASKLAVVVSVKGIKKSSMQLQW